MRRTARLLLALPVAALGLALAVLVGIAIANTFTLNVARSANVMDNGVGMTRAIAVSSRGLAVYTLSGDSKSHPECTAANHCFSFWPPLTVASARHLTKASAIKGKLGVWRRDGFNQLTLNGHPLYRYAGDGGQRDFASGDGIRTFGGVWHVVGASVPGGSSSSTPSTSTTPMSPTTTTMTTPTTTTTPPPYYP